MPIAQHILQPFELGNELLSFFGRPGKLCRITRPLAQNAVLMQQGLVTGALGSIFSNM